jgi:hypothetical protein
MHFVDDRLDVLGHLEGVVPDRFPVRAAEEAVFIGAIRGHQDLSAAA